MTRRLFVLVLLFILTACSGPLTVGGTFTARQDDGSGWRVTLPETRLDVQALAAYTLTPTATATPTLTSTPAPTITGTPTMTPLWNTLTPIATLPTYTTSLIQDTFNDTEGTALAAHVIAPVNTPSTSWTVHAGTWIISGNQVKKTATANTFQSASVNAGIANADVSAVVYEQNTGIVARLTDDNNYWMLLVTNASGIYIFEKTGGTFTPRAVTAATVSFPVTARFVVNGTTLTGYVNDKIVTFTSSVRQSATRHGLAIYPANAIADNFVVSNP